MTRTKMKRMVAATMAIVFSQPVFSWAVQKDDDLIMVVHVQKMSQRQYCGQPGKPQDF